jgi:hypothetical protein
MGASVCLTAGGVAVIRVSVTYGDLVVEADFEAEHYSPDVVEDLTTRCATALLATLRAMWDMPKAGAQ